jgi:hypothetical protein
MSVSLLESTSSLPYLYDPLPRGSIRVLKLEGTCLVGNGDEPFRDLAIQCSLHTISLHHARGNKPQYAALSYVWGSTQMTRPLVCNGHTLPITQNLHDALWRMAFVQPRPPLELLWVDAVCINQKDQGEKMTQVNLMGQIYGMASVVLVWLGTAAEVAGGPFERFWQYTQKGDRLALDNDHAARERGVDFVTGSDWFKRVWTLQEIVLAKRALFYCGQFTASWDSLVNMAPIMNSKNKITELTRIHQLSEVVRSGRQTKGQSKSRLSDIVQYTSGRQATMLHDRIFGLRGLYGGNWAVYASYADSATKVLAQATMMLLQEQGNLNFLKLLRLKQVHITPPTQDSPPPKDDNGRRRKQGSAPLVPNVFRPRMAAASWVPTWSAPSRKVQDTRRRARLRRETKLLQAPREDVRQRKDACRVTRHGTVGARCCAGPCRARPAGCRGRALLARDAALCCVSALCPRGCARGK